MSEHVISKKLQRKCEGCEKEFVYEMVNPTDDQVTEITNWYTIVRNIADTQSGRFVPIMVQACSMPCVGPAALKLAVIPSNTPDDIDLSTLQAGAIETAN